MGNIRTYKRKLILNKQQEQRLLGWIGTCRFIYNMALEIRKEAWKNKQINIHKYELSGQITQIRDIDWIADLPRDILDATLDRLYRAFDSFFTTYKKGGGYPKFASKRKFNSIAFKRDIRVKGNFVVVPKIGKLKMFKDSEILGEPVTASIVKEPTGFFICIQCKDVPNKFDSESQAIGLDMGISSFCIDSNGNFIANPKHFKKYERQLRIENRSLSRKKKGSNSWRKQAKKLSLLHHKIANIRMDFLHKESTKIAKTNSVVYLEDLNILNMVRNHSLSKHILDAGWGTFREMLSYKTRVVKINPKYTSQTCNECGVKDSRSRISQSEFVCTSCGHISNADVNAAKNILDKGIVLDRKREPLGCA